MSFCVDNFQSEYPKEILEERAVPSFKIARPIRED